MFFVSPFTKKKIFAQFLHCMCCPVEKSIITQMSDTNLLEGREWKAGRMKQESRLKSGLQTSLTVAFPLKRSHWLFTLIIFEINAGWCLLRTLKRPCWIWLLAKREAQCTTNVHFFPPSLSLSPSPSHALLSFLSKGLFNYLWYHIRANLQPCLFM